MSDEEEITYLTPEELYRSVNDPASPITDHWLESLRRHLYKSDELRFDPALDNYVVTSRTYALVKILAWCTDVIRLARYTRKNASPIVLADEIGRTHAVTSILREMVQGLFEHDMPVEERRG